MPQPTADNSAIPCPPSQVPQFGSRGGLPYPESVAHLHGVRGCTYGIDLLKEESSDLYCPFKLAHTDRGCERRVIRRATAARPITRNERVEGSGMGSTVMYASNSASFSRRKPLLTLVKSGGGRAPSGRDSPMNSGVWFHPNVSTIGSTTERAKRRLRPARCENWSPSGSGARLLVATLASANSPRLAGEWASTHEAHTSHGNLLTGIVVGCCQRRSSGWRYRCARPTQQRNRHTSSRAKLRSPFGESVAAHGRRHHKWRTEGRHGHDLMSRLHRTLA